MEVRVRHQFVYQWQDMAVTVTGAGLQRKPFVQHQLVALEHRVETRQRLARQRVRTGDQRGQG